MTDHCPDNHIDGFALIDRVRSVDLDSVGGTGLTLALAVDDTGAEHLGVIERRTLGPRTEGFSLGSPDHEQLGPLPLEFARRVAVAQRRLRIVHRCGRETKAGNPCCNQVRQLGAPCNWHRTNTTHRKGLT